MFVPMWLGSGSLTVGVGMAGVLVVMGLSDRLANGTFTGMYIFVGHRSRPLFPMTAEHKIHIGRRSLCVFRSELGSQLQQPFPFPAQFCASLHSSACTVLCELHRAMDPSLHLAALEHRVRTLEDRVRTLARRQRMNTALSGSEQ